MGFVAERAKGNNASGTSHTISLTAAPAVGNHIVLIIFLGTTATSTASASSFADNATGGANTYQTDNSTLATTLAQGCYIVSSKIARSTGMTQITFTTNRAVISYFKVV